MIKIGSQCDRKMENRLSVIEKDYLPDQNWFAMIKIGSQCDGEIENQLAVIKKDLRDQNWFAMIKIGSQCDGEMENRLAVIKKILCVIKIGSRCDGEIENRLAVIKNDSLRDQNWLAMIKIGSRCDGEIENLLAVFGARRGSMPSADGMDHPRMAWDPRLAWPWRAIRGSVDGMAAFGAICGSADGSDQMQMTHMQDFLPFHP